ncbi:SMI1/KNR4 family protein [Metabacillus sp. cB07]|uniref:SMI1/KNR4 family protein n=1 Tax=Metabacillus sp. cB07 TaxID=2806989 RepID=UPI001939AFAB|nr:SMI1/KNR4 family protein [Metabacillus sp. cB07]
MMEVNVFYETIKNEILAIYGGSYKNLRNKTMLLGELDEGRWHTALQPPLTVSEIARFEEQMQTVFPFQYKECLFFTNGCWFFDLLRIAGKAPDTYRGMSEEEESFSPFPLEDLQQLYKRKRTPPDHFIFADSFVKQAYYAIDSTGDVHEVSYKTKRTIRSFYSLEQLLRSVVEEGKEQIENDLYYEFT